MKNNIQLSEIQHAQVFMFIGQELRKNFDDNQFEEIISELVKKYGMQRGNRMAMRAKANSHELSMLNYMAYSEFVNKTSIMKKKISGVNGHTKVVITKCPWCETWKENNALDFGKYYCKFVDKSLVKGFNSNLNIDINSTLSNQNEACEFIFHDLNVGIGSYVKLAIKKLFKPGKRALMPWSFHICHLISTTSEILIQQKCSNSDAIINNIIIKIRQEFPESDANEILGYLKNDFSKI
ncbi:MAG: L-2-amino-thiazoline-4-carboxylic acid hydrolase [Bacteroidales bacterium]|nr:L-2-amino-thiazoline-4-carboxylic acid hydrolase [Bacteroidales bacterium]